MINENDLYDTVYSALVGYSQGAYTSEMSAPQHMKIMGDAMKAYFEAHTVITYGWSARDPYNIPDPAVSFTSKAAFPAFDLTQPMNLPGLAAKITAAFQAASIKHPGAWTIPDGSFLIRPLTLPQSPSASSALMDCIIRPVCAWAKTLINPTPLSGAHGVFVGATTNMAIA